MRIVAAADLHLDSTMVGSWNSQEGIWDNWVESFTQLNRLVDTVNEYDADLLVIAGDIFHTGRPTAEAVYRTTSALNRLRRAKVVMTNGNHDQATVVGQHRTPIDAYIANQSWCHHVASTTEMIQYDGFGLALVPWYRVAGSTKLEATSYELQEDIRYLFERVSNQNSPTMLFGHILLSEATFSSGMRSSELKMMPSILEASVPLDLLDSGPTCYNALGHVHRAQQPSQHTEYLGSTYKVDFGEMNEQKGCTVFDIDEKGNVSRQYIPFPVRELFAIDLSSGISLDESTASQLRQRDILRMVVSSEGLDQKSKNLIQDLEKRGVRIEYRYAPPERRERSTIQDVKLDSNPTEAFYKYAEKNLDKEDLDYVMKIFRNIYDEAE